MDLFKEKNIRKTPFREAVVQIFQKFENAIPISLIEENLQGCDRITLYRTIKTFKEAGLIHEISIPEQVPVFALCEEGCSTEHHHHNHIHFMCIKCDEVFCKDISNFPRITLKDFDIEELEIVAKGTCKNCK